MSTWLDALGAVEDVLAQMAENTAQRKQYEAQKLRAGIDQLIKDFGRSLIKSWNNDAPKFQPEVGRKIKLVYIGEFTESNWNKDQTEPERLYSDKYGTKVILYIGNDRQLYTYESRPRGNSRQVIDFRRVDLSKASHFRLRRYHEELLAVGIR